MMNVSAIKSFGAVQPCAAMMGKANKDRFSEIFDRMKTLSGSSVSSDEDNEEITKIREMADGSLVLEKIEGSRLVSQTKIAGPKLHLPSQQKWEMQADGTMQLIDKFNDTSASMGVSAGALFCGLV